MASLPGFTFNQGAPAQPTAPFTATNTPSQVGAALPGFSFGGGQAAPVDDKPAFEMVFGFIPTLNVGNILGVENDVARTVTNIVADPFAWLPAIFSGGLTVGAKAASAASRLNSAKGILRLTSKGAGTKGRLLKSAQNIAAAQKAAVTSVKALHAPKELLGIAAKAAQSGDTATYVKTMRQILKSELPADVKKALDVTLDDIGSLKDLGKLETKLGKQSQFKNMDVGVKDKAIASILDDGFLKSRRVSQLEAGQRSFLRIKAPFTPDDGKVLIHGRALYGVMDKFKPLKLRKVGGGTAAALLGTSLLDKGESLLRANKHTDELIEGWAKEIDHLAPGAIEGGMDDIMKFYIQEKGIPVSELERLGIPIEESLAKTLSTIDKVGQTGERIKDGIKILPHRELEKLLKNKGWKDVMDTTKAHIGEHLEQLRVSAIDTGMVDDIPRLERYINQMWNMDKTTAAREATLLKKSGSMMQKRKFQSYVEGMNNMYTPKHESTFDLVRAYQREISEVVENRKIISKLKSKSNKVWIDGHESKFFETTIGLEKLAKKGVDVDANFVNIAKGGEKALKFLEKVGVLRGDALKAASVGRPHKNSAVFVPKQVANSLKILYESKSTHEAAVAVDRFNAVSKIASLSFSLFHAGALTETAVATMGVGKGLKETAKRGFGIPILSQILKKAGVSKPATDELIQRVQAAGLQTGAASDAQRGVLDEFFEAASTKLDGVLPGLGAIPRFGKKFSDIVNDSLWNNFHEPLKIVNWEHQLAKLQSNPAFNFLPIKELERKAAALSNDAFGGQAWEQLGVHPKFKQMLHWALLAPDWTISNARIAGVGTTGLKGLARGVVGKGRNPTESMVGSYWRTAIPTMYGAMNLLNKSLSGHYMWENPPGKQLEVALGTTDDKGQMEFMKLGKQMREPFRWLTDPLSIGGGKTAPFAKEVVEQLSGRSPGSQFPTAFANDFHKKPQAFVEQIPARIGNTLAKFVPFSINGKSVLLAFPKSSMSAFTVEKALIDSLQDGKVNNLLRSTGLRDKKAKEIRTIITIARSAGMDVNRIMGNVKRKIGDEAQILERFKQGTVR